MTSAGGPKPYVICHAVASIDGRILTRRWRPEDASRGAIFERLHDQLGVDAWLIGRISGQGYSKRESYPVHTEQRYPRQNWFARRNAAAYGICSMRTAKSPGAAAMSIATPFSSC